MLNPFQIVKDSLNHCPCCLLGLAQNLAMLFTVKVISGLVANDR